MSSGHTVGLYHSEHLLHEGQTLVVSSLMIYCSQRSDGFKVPFLLSYQAQGLGLKPSLEQYSSILPGQGQALSKEGAVPLEHKGT